MKAKKELNEIDRLRVQLAGCGVAALGGISPKTLASPESYGWSASYGDVVKLRMAFERISKGKSPDQILERWR